ncbi:response regulator [Marinisporobacter balticus]|uniref:Stage 0 sporulation protein A homolog n=1 Tax=Marinisporobacter balticus TaxID=2018667 RepID=A0A4R2KSZ1_9FIRM|nr:response regulator [Marinisporobacter balticus]TCO76893.1 chemotaxis phosphatase CheX-like protein [Marinisporobacter balticus]
MKNVKIVIVDDSPFSISILRDILAEKEFEVVGQASSLEETIKVVKETKPDLVTMDMTIPGTDGLECTRAIHKIDANIKVVVVSSMKDDEIVKKAKVNKVAGYVQKPVDPDEIATVINRAMAGDDLLLELQEIYFDVFKESFSNNLNRITKTIPTYGEMGQSNDTENSRGISIVIGIIGKCSGRMILDLSHETAKKLAEAALKREVKNMDECLAMLGEFTNIIGGNACSILNRKNKIFGLRVAPPTIFHGESLKISKSMLRTTSVLGETSFGEMYLNVGFERDEEEWM